MKHYWEKIEELRQENAALRLSVNELEELYHETDLSDDETLSIIENHIIELRNAIKRNCDRIERLRYDYKCARERTAYPVGRDIYDKINHDGFIVAVKF